MVVPRFFKKKLVCPHVFEILFTALKVLKFHICPFSLSSFFLLSSSCFLFQSCSSSVFSSLFLCVFFILSLFFVLSTNCFYVSFFTCTMSVLHLSTTNWGIKCHMLFFVDCVCVVQSRHRVTDSRSSV